MNPEDEQIAALADLEDDWDGYDGRTPTALMVLTARLLVACLRRALPDLPPGDACADNSGAIRVDWRYPDGFGLAFVTRPSGAVYAMWRPVGENIHRGMHLWGADAVRLLALKRQEAA